MGIAAPMLLGILLSGQIALADPIVIPFPVESPVSVDLAVTPVVTIGTRTIDFTPNLNQEFIAFLPFGAEVSHGTFRNTLAVRARDGLVELSGQFPRSPDPGFVNQVPLFDFGTTNLLVFDVIIPGWGTDYGILVVDRNGDRHTANFSNPVPEPTSVLLVGSGAAMLWVRARRGRRHRASAQSGL
jgi:hypothetical protein